MNERFETTPITEVITEFALALCSQDAEGWTPIGTAIAIAPHLILTAKHVVDGLWKPHHLRRPDKSADSTVIAYQVLPNAVGSLWYAKNVYYSPHSDLVILEVFPYSESAKDYRWRKVLMNFAIPEVGQTLQGFGYSGSRIDASADYPSKVVWKTQPRTTHGKVTAIYNSGRDQGMFKFPCFEMSAHTEPGMSGGPLFDGSGRLCGVVCGGGLDRDDGTSIQYGTLLWPLLLIRGIRGRFEGEAERFYTFYELISRKAVAAIGLDMFHIQELKDGGVSVALRRNLNEESSI